MEKTNSNDSPKTIDNTTGNSDHHSIRITTIKLNGDNFYRWSLSVRMYVRGHGKIGYLTGEKKESVESDSKHATRDAENSMEEDISSNYLGYSTAKEM